MKTIHVDFSSRNGRIKPMNAVNNGPTGMSERGTSNFLDYKALEIPYARNHDASFYYGYGGEHPRRRNLLQERRHPAQWN